MGAVWAEVHGGRGPSCADSRRHWIRRSETQLCRRVHAPRRRFSYGLVDVRVGRAGRASQYFQYEWFAAGRIGAAAAGLMTLRKAFCCFPMASILRLFLMLAVRKDKSILRVDAKS